MAKDMMQIKWHCPNSGCNREITMEMDPEPKRDGRAIVGDDLEAEKRQVERAMEKQAQRHLEMCKPARALLAGVSWSTPAGRREKGPDED
jgi:U3 small nucleolar RNA-associated protein 14